MSVLLKEGTCFPYSISNGGPADVTEGIGQDVERAQPSQVKDSEQDAFTMAELLREGAAAGTGLARATAPLMAEAFGLSRLPCGEPLGERVQRGAGKSGQGRVGQPLDDGGARGAQITVQEGEQVGRR